MNRTHLSNLRIAIFTRYLPSMGGVEFFTDNLAGALTKAGAHVVVITTDQEKEDLRRPFLVVRIPSSELLQGRYPVFNTAAARKTVDDIIQREDINAYVVNGRFYQLSRFGAKIARQHGKRAVVIDHSSSYVSDTASLMGKALAAADHASTSLLDRYHPVYYCVSKLSSRWISTFGLTSSGEIHNAIDADAFISEASAYSLEPVQDSSLKILYAGRLIEEKGVRRVIEAIKQTEAKAEAFIAGSGPLAPYVEQEAAVNPRIHFLGRLSHPDLSAAMQQADIFCFPTTYGEGLPTCLLEAGACSCALMTTMTGGTEEIIPTERYGIVLENVSPKEIARQVDQLEKNPARLKALQRNIASHIRQHFGWTNTVEELASALQDA